MSGELFAFLDGDGGARSRRIVPERDDGRDSDGREARVTTRVVQLVVAEKPSVARDIARVLGARPSGRGCFEGNGRVITWCVGHLVELEEPGAYEDRWKAWRLDTLPMLPAEFRLRPSKHGADQLRCVVGLLRERRFEVVVNACDAGREGELIFRYVMQYARCSLPSLRLWISSLTDEAIRNGFAALRPGQAFDALGDAARARSEADWLVGMNATRAITTRSRSGGGGGRDGTLYSIGRVQTPTLAMLVDRERAIQAFVPQSYWEVEAQLATATAASTATANGRGREGEPESFRARWTRGKVTRLAAAPLAEAVVARCRREPHAIVEKVTAKTVREPPPLLFDLTSLQRTANRRFGFSAARTLEIAQALYERHKVLTYPRTDSRHLTTDVAKELPKLFGALRRLPEYAPFADALVARPPRPGRRIVDDAKVSDHHAIIPTGKAPGSGLDRDEERIFDLVVRRFLGAFFPDAVFAVTEVVIRVGEGDGGRSPATATIDAEKIDPTKTDAAPAGQGAPMVRALPPPPDRFVARGRVRVEAGWQEVAGLEPPEARRERDREHSGDGEDEPTQLLPPLVEGQVLGGQYAARAKQTTPPRRHTEATLLAAMESAGRAIEDEALRAAMKECGLGTPATRAAVIETLLKRGYIERDRKQVAATSLGMSLIASLPVSSLSSPELTGTWEARLSRIARGQEARAAFMADIATYVRETVDAIRAAPPPAVTGPAPPRPPPSSPEPRRHASTGANANDRERGSERSDGSERGDRSGRDDRRPTRDGDRRAAPARPAAKRRPRDDGGEKRSPKLAPALAELVCPRCRQGTLVEGKRGWGCARWREGCGFVVWFETAGRKLSAAQLRDLVQRGRTRVARFTPDGQAVEGRLVLDATAPGGAARFEPAT